MSSTNQKYYGPSFDVEPRSVTRSSTTTTTSSGSGNSITSSAFSELLKRNPQKVSDRYVKLDKLKKYLGSKYKPKEWEVYVSQSSDRVQTARIPEDRRLFRCVMIC